MSTSTLASPGILQVPASPTVSTPTPIAPTPAAGVVPGTPPRRPLATSQPVPRDPNRRYCEVVARTTSTPNVVGTVVLVASASREQPGTPITTSVEVLEVQAAELSAVEVFDRYIWQEPAPPPRPGAFGRNLNGWRHAGGYQRRDLVVLGPAGRLATVAELLASGEFLASVVVRGTAFAGHAGRLEAAKSWVKAQAVAELERREGAAQAGG